MFVMARGTTGFRDYREPALPEVDVRRFRAACYAAARAAGGTVDAVRAPTYLGNFHTASITTACGPFTMWCHGHYPWLAFVAAEPSAASRSTVFMDPPEWADTFTDCGFTVLRRALLDSPLTAVDTTALTGAEWAQIRTWQPASVGETLFNRWD